MIPILPRIGIAIFIWTAAFGILSEPVMSGRKSGTPLLDRLFYPVAIAASIFLILS